jgi:flagellin
MALAIATNTGALMAAASASSVNKDMETSMERLSTGKRINSAKDDAAGVAIASRLGSEIRGTNQAIRNALDAQGLINTAEGAHKEVENILQRMREVAVQAANDTNGTSDRVAMQAEMTQLTQEIDRIAATTTWAGISLLNGGASAGSVNAAADTSQTFNFQIATNTAGTGDTLAVAIKDIGSLSLGIGGSATTPAVAVSVTAPASGAGVAFNAVASSGSITFTAATTAATAANQAKFTFTVAGGQQFTFDAFTHGTQKGFADTNNGMASAFVQFVKDQPGLAGVTGTPTTNTVALTKANSVSVASNSAAQTAINNIDGAISELNAQRASLGAYSNRLDSTVSNLTNVAIQLEGGKGRIEDADFAAESTNLAKSQILQQASTAMLAQANASKQSVLSLLQG